VRARSLPRRRAERGAFEQFIVWEMAQKHWVDTRGRPSAVCNGNGETVSRFEETARAAGATRTVHRDPDSNEVAQHIGRLRFF
jgi:hypothetical protein